MDSSNRRERLRHRASRACGIVLTLACCACGSGAADGVLEESTTAESAVTGKAGPVESSVQAAALQAPSQGPGAAFKDVLQPSAQASLTTQGFGPTTRCTLAWQAPPALTRSVPAPLPANGGVFYDQGELVRFRQRAASGPFLVADDYRPGSPGDRQRLSDNTRRFLAEGEVVLGLADDGQVRATHGSLARDAALQYLLSPNPAVLQAVQAYLLRQAANPANDFTRLCLRTLDGVGVDGWYYHGAWLLRYIATYDAVRGALSSDRRVAIENLIRRDAYAMAAQLDWGLAHVFPSRLAGNYTVRGADAASVVETDKWLKLRHDTNGDCQVDAADDPVSRVARAYVHADGRPGPTVSVLSQWFNNRRAATAAAVGVAGVALADPVLVDRAKRYFMEWLRYGVWPDGSQGEYARNGDYCIAQQGVIYGYINLQGAAMVAQVLARQGDRSLIDYKTSVGLMGSEDGAGDAPKSIERVIRTQIGQRLGQLDWYADEPWRGTLPPRPEARLGEVQARYMNGRGATDNYQELGLLMVAPYYPDLPIAALVLRDPALTSLPFPGAGGRSVATGFGSWADTWTDVFNATASQLLLRP